MSSKKPQNPGSSGDLAAMLSDGLRHHQSGRLEEADSMYRLILDADPEHPAAHHLAGLVDLGRGRAGSALQHFEKAVAGDPDNADFRLNTGVALDTLGRSPDAIAHYRKAIALDPAQPTAHANLGFALRGGGQYPDALDAFTRALELDPDHVGATLGLVSILKGIRSPEYSTHLEAALLQALASPHGNHADLAGPCAHQLGLKFDLAKLDAEAIADDALFARFLSQCVNTDVAMELFLTGLRRRLLFDAGNLSGRALKTAALLGVQCFMNEYVFFAEEDEIAAAAEIRQTPEGLILRSLYGPLRDIDNIANPSPELETLIKLTLEDHRTEQALKAGIETLGSISDETSKAVRAMYEENPYPRWLQAPAQQPATVAAKLATMFPHFRLPAPLPDPPNILIAGCGSGQHVVQVARSHPNARILALDLSTSSLAYAVRMCEQLGVASVRFLQADILNLGAIDERFNMIQSVGVLHHMKDPVLGWANVAALLKPGGVFKAGLYSERGRQQIRHCSNIIAGDGIGTSPAEIANFRRRLIDGHIEGDFSDILGTADFYSTSMCRDLLFHVQEQHWTPKRLKDDIAGLGLRFIGFEGFEDTGINAAYRDAYPDDTGLTDLDNWEAFEKANDALTDMYLIWCLKA
ncbi:MAG: tetratricopeptide repeat protein [Proteobacteria bacterium]|nr:tetratricopeptide repeat protein [Pseudomonadota bacterium]